MKESVFSRRIQKKLRDLGAWVVKYYASQFTPKGIPDLLVCYKGKFIGLELKTKSALSSWQKWQGNKIKDAGGLWYVVTPTTDLAALLNEANDESAR